MTIDFTLSFHPSSPSLNFVKLATYIQDNNVARRRRAVE